MKVETGTMLTPTGEVKALTPAEWAESEHRCKALDHPDQPQATATARVTGGGH